MKGKRMKTVKYKGKITNKNDIKTTYQALRQFLLKKFKTKESDRKI